MAEFAFRGPFVITGLSGSGKTVLSRGLEDIGYQCVDNIPLDLVQALFERSAADLARLVVVLDVRTKGFTDAFPAVFQELKGASPTLQLVFVEASPEVLLRRFSVSRRPHPLRDRNIERAIADEARSLAPVRTLAHLIIDTNLLSPHDLRRHVLELGGIGETAQELLSVEVQSFSYLQGVPPTASLVFDVRFLPNPYFEESLRALAGDDPAVSTWLERHAEVEDAVTRMSDLVTWLLPRYGAELKTHVTIAVGCTGGRHRSVYVAERLASSIRDAGYRAVIDHRDKDRWRFP